MELYTATQKDFMAAKARYGLANRRFDDIMIMDGDIEVSPEDRRQIDSWLTLAEATIAKIEAGKLDINHTYDIETALEKAKPFLDKYPVTGNGAPVEVVLSGQIRRTSRAYRRLNSSDNRGNDPSSIIKD